MATVTIPFPSTETLLGPELAKAASPPNINTKPPTKKAPAFKKHCTLSKNITGVAKPKQTKSRNGKCPGRPYHSILCYERVLQPDPLTCDTGCHTCKEKRLKCDETKPRCDQCKKRNVECGGYNKIFQWRPEEKATFRVGPTPKNRRSK